MALLVPPEDLQMSGNLEEAWPLFKQRFLLYLKATGAAHWPDDQKVALFLTIAGPEALQVFNSFRLDPKEEDDFEVVLTHFEGHCMPPRNETYERFLFRTRLQGLNESLEDFVADLQHKSRFCNFGDQRESLVRDQVVLGCRDGSLMQRLLQEEGLTLERALQICRSAEEKEEAQRANDLSGQPGLCVVEKETQLKVSKGQPLRRKVRHARSTNHRRDNCPRKESFKTYV